ncbi:major facilitator superfamily domain-containing protein [Immersiella caudata]|uniref:Major facilitator superfamily domain-containing protein n=1 Tax=Immersiella caudata TaxID=314043 RepID=A0AA39WBA0_9PEZI|nr:major facilitator superfamily domain-containing protein [Immersiella caudata]
MNGPVATYSAAIMFNPADRKTAGAPEHEPKPQDTSDINTSNEKDTEDDTDSEVEDHDGFRPSSHEVRLSCTRSRASAKLGSGAATTSGRLQLEPTLSRRDTVLSRIRSRPSNVDRFTHPLSHVRTTKEDLVDFDGPDDPYRPMNWPMHKKVVTTGLYGFVTMGATWASAAYAPGTAQIAVEFRVSETVSILGTSLFLIGFGIGPLLWAPLSEVYGRRLAVFAPMFVAICFTFASATAKDFQTLMITRFFSAFFSSAPVTNTGGVLGDLFSPAQRGIAIAGYAMAVVGGPVLGPIASTAIVINPHLGWRWTLYMTGILESFFLLLALLFIDETYPPQLLVYKARRLRMTTGNWALHAKHEEWDVSLSELANKFLLRPIQLLGTPICFLIALYASFCYGILYMQLGAIPFIFHTIRGWSALPSTLPFVCLLIGATIGCILNIYNQLLYNKVYHAAGNRPVPESRLPPMMVGSVLFAGGQFLTGWTSSPSIHWIVPCIGLVLLGTGFFTIFQAALNYLVDTFQKYAASAVAANTFLRSCFACAFPLVVGPMYGNLGVGPGSSIPAGFAVLLIPVPFVFYVFGKRIRRRGKWSRGSVWD